jgi:hypothetical protein
LITALDGNDNINVSDDASTDTIDGGSGWDNLNLRLSGTAGSNAITIGTNANIKGIENFNVDGNAFSSATTVTVTVTDGVFSSSGSTNANVNAYGTNTSYALNASKVSASNRINLNGGQNNDTLTGISGPLRMYLAPLDNGAHVPVKIVADTDKVGKVTLTAKTLRFEPLVTTAATATKTGGGR